MSDKIKTASILSALLLVLLFSYASAEVIISPTEAVNVSNEDGFSAYPTISYNKSSEKFGIAWLDDRNSDWNLMFSRLNTSGAIEKSEKTLDDYTPVSTTRVSMVYLKDSSDFVMTWNGKTTVWSSALLFAKVNDDGTLNGSVYALKSLYNTDQEPSITRNGSEYGVVIADRTAASSDKDIHFYNVSSSGSITGYANITSTLSGNSIQPSIASDGSNYAVVFANNKSGEYKIYCAIVTPDGKVDSLNTICDHDYDAYYPAISYSKNTDNYMSVFYEKYSGSYSIMMQRIATDGDSTGSKVALYSSSGDARMPSIAFNGISEYGITFQSDAYGTEGIWFMAVSDTGTINQDALEIAGSTYDLLSPDIASCGTKYGITWYKNKDSNEEVYFTTVEVKPAVVTPTPTPSPTPTPTPSPTPLAPEKIYEEAFDNQGLWECLGSGVNPAPASVAEWANGRLVCKWSQNPLPAPGFYQWLKWNPAHTGVAMTIPYFSNSFFALRARMSADSNDSVPQIRLRAQAGDDKWTAYGLYAGDVNLNQSGGAQTTPQYFYLLWQPQGTTESAFTAVDIYSAIPNLGEIYIDDINVYRIEMPGVFSVEKAITDFSSGWTTLPTMTNVTIGSQIVIGDTTFWSTAGSFLDLQNDVYPSAAYRIKYTLTKFGSANTDQIRLRAADTLNGAYSSCFVIAGDQTTTISKDFLLYHYAMNYRDPGGDISVFLDTIEREASAASVVLSKLIVERFDMPVLN